MTLAFTFTSPLLCRTHNCKKCTAVRSDALSLHVLSAESAWLLIHSTLSSYLFLSVTILIQQPIFNFNVNFNFNLHVNNTPSAFHTSQECYRTSDHRFQTERGMSVCLSLQSLTLKDLSLAGRSHPIVCWRDPGPDKFHSVSPLGEGLRPPMISLALVIPASTARRKNTVRIFLCEVACVHLKRHSWFSNFLVTSIILMHTHIELLIG